ncbi:efflux transporter outer membrane subunit [Terricaulis sp.]|uniref:efflux transporter outer membrane subunit n=1 Tax=Terricaulis sp. TaxID=2768686 RepID=UPI0037834895
MIKSVSRRLILACTTAMLVACATPPDLGARPEMAAPDRYDSVQSFAAPVADWPSDRWWQAYGDPALNALIEEALADSPTLAAAAARMRQAQAGAQQTGSSRYPSVQGQTGIETSRQDLSASNIPEAIRDSLPEDWETQTSASLQFSYQLDFFGRNRASFAQATSRAEAMEAEAAEARLQISTAVALAYAELVRYTADRRQLEQAAELRQYSATLTRDRVTAGLENEAPAQQATTELARARADLIALDAEIIRTRHQLAALLGKGPDRGLEIAVPQAPALTRIGLPARVDLDLIGRRPDLVAARLRAESAAEGINVARADFYPNVNLAAVVGIQTLGLGRLGSGDLSFAQVGPAVSLPIFSGGRIEGAYRGARADYDEAVALYNDSLTTALREVADALNDRRAIEAELAEQRQGLVAAEAAYRVIRLRYEGGLASYIDTLSVESSLIDQRRTVAALEARAFSLDITLIRALGGGFTTAS